MWDIVISKISWTIGSAIHDTIYCLFPFTLYLSNKIQLFEIGQKPKYFLKLCESVLNLAYLCRVRWPIKIQTDHVTFGFYLCMKQKDIELYVDVQTIFSRCLSPVQYSFLILRPQLEVSAILHLKQYFTNICDRRYLKRIIFSCSYILGNKNDSKSTLNFSYK